MKHWQFARRAAVPTPVTEPSVAPAPVAPTAPDLSRFDSFTAADVAALPGRLRRSVIADRKRRVTAALARVAAGKPRAWK
jgi:hypothetical protein